MRNKRDCLDQVFGATLAKYGFEFDTQSRMFIRNRDDIRDGVTLLVDFLGDLDVMVCTANLSISCRRLPEDDRQAIRPVGPTAAANNTLRCNIGYLMPGRQWHEWEIALDSSVDRLTADMGNTIITYGIPWLDRFQSPADVMEQLRRVKARGLEDSDWTGLKTAFVV